MAVSGFLFISWRIFQIILLIPVVGMLSWFVHGYVQSNQLTPNFILVLFIVSVLALAWTFATLFNYLRARHDAFFVALIDLGFVGALIGGIVTLRGIANQDCSNFSAGSLYVNLGPFGYYGRQSNSPWAVNINKTCAMLKASWALAIILTLTFFVTFVGLPSGIARYGNLTNNSSHSSSLSSFTATTATMTASWSSANTTPHVTATAVLPAAAVVAAAPATPRVNTALVARTEASRGGAHTTFERRHMKSNATENDKNITTSRMDALFFGHQAGVREFGQGARLCISLLKLLTHDRTTFTDLSPLGRGASSGSMATWNEMYLERLYPLMKKLHNKLLLSDRPEQCAIPSIRAHSYLVTGLNPLKTRDVNKSVESVTGCAFV
jgi:hypothetical protein